MSDPMRPEDIEIPKSDKPSDRATPPSGGNSFLKRIGGFIVVGVPILLALVIGLIFLEDVVTPGPVLPTIRPTNTVPPTETPQLMETAEFGQFRLDFEGTQDALATEQNTLLTQMALASTENAATVVSTMDAINLRIDEINVQSTQQWGTRIAVDSGQGTAIADIQAEVAPISETQAAVVSTVNAIQTKSAEPCRITPEQASGAAIRRLPDPASDQMFTLTFGDDMEIIGDNNGELNNNLWWQVEFEVNSVEYTGWIFSGVVDEIGVTCFES